MLIYENRWYFKISFRIGKMSFYYFCGVCVKYRVQGLANWGLHSPVLSMATFLPSQYGWAVVTAIMCPLKLKVSILRPFIQNFACNMSDILQHRHAIRYSSDMCFEGLHGVHLISPCPLVRMFCSSVTLISHSHIRLGYNSSLTGPPPLPLTLKKLVPTPAGAILMSSHSMQMQ